MKQRRRSFRDQIDILPVDRSWFEVRPWGRWSPAWQGMGRSPLYGWHVNPWMGRGVRRHFQEDA